MSRSRKVLVLALDAANPDLLRTWAADGTMPNLAALMAGGMVANTQGVEGMYVGATWPSFYMSADPSWHGLYWTERLKSGTYRTQRSRPDDFARYPALWEVLSQANRRVAVMDVPLTRISPRLNGPQIVEWGVHDALFGFRTRPRSLGRRIRRTVGAHPVPTNCDARRNLDEYREFAGQLEDGAAARAKLTIDLLADGDWDFAIQVFSETHCAGHQLWHFHDPAHPAYEAPSGSVPGDLLKGVYQAVDRALGEIVASLEPSTTLVTLSLHGMQHTCGGSLLLPEILHRLGVCGPPPAEGRDLDSREAEPSSDRPSQPNPAGEGGALKRLYRRLPERLRRSVYDARQWVNQEWLGRGTLIDLDASRAQAFYIGFGVGSTFSGIRLNLRGREPDGQLAPGAEAERFCDQLTSDLLEVRRTSGGEPLVRQVHRTRDLYHGPRTSELPDLLVEWEPEPAMGTTVAGSGAGSTWTAESPKVGRIEAHNSYCRTGEHRIEGLLVAKGRAIPPGRLERTVSILDIAPTLAALLECEMPSAGGEPIAELLGPQLWG